MHSSTLPTSYQGWNPEHYAVRNKTFYDALSFAVVGFLPAPLRLLAKTNDLFFTSFTCFNNM
jgi:hypothetical protein